MKRYVLYVIILFTSYNLINAQDVSLQKSNMTRSKYLPEVIKIKNTLIPGAPILDSAILIKGTIQEIRTEKHGLVYPAFYDWNKDGKTDLLLGEFETGQTGSNIKIYLNCGTNKKPEYTGKYFYATDINKDTITSHQWCCIGIHPRIIDIDGDGFLDILTGQYDPGLVSLWRGSENGFKTKEIIHQDGYNPTSKLDFLLNNQLDPKCSQYWIYTSAGFGDFDGDGLLDLFVGGFGELRVALNTGTKENPSFGLRKYLLGVDGLPISVIKPSDFEIEKAKKNNQNPHYSGVIKSFITPVDWDNDGILDILVTHAYGDPKIKDPIHFFRGVKTDKGLRFLDAVSLFSSVNAKKTFPGCQPNIVVTDYNRDGINDLVIGVSLPTINGFDVDTTFAWSFIKELGIEYPGKDAGRAIEWEGGIEKLINKIETRPEFRSYYLGKFHDYKYLTLRHRGYVYVIIGKKNPLRAVPEPIINSMAEVNTFINTKSNLD